MLKFGLFTEYCGQNSKNIFKDIICYLSFILELDVDYATELIKNGSTGKEKAKIPSLKRSTILFILFFCLCINRLH